MLSKKSWSSSGTSFRRLLLCVCTRKCRGKSSNCFQCASFLTFPLMIVLASLIIKESQQLDDFCLDLS